MVIISGVPIFRIFTVSTLQIPRRKKLLLITLRCLNIKVKVVLRHAVISQQTDIFNLPHVICYCYVKIIGQTSQKSV